MLSITRIFHCVCHLAIVSYNFLICQGHSNLQIWQPQISRDIGVFAAHDLVHLDLFKLMDSGMQLVCGVGANLYVWLVVWNIFYFPYIRINHPNWLIFFRGVETTKQMLLATYRMKYPFPHHVVGPRVVGQGSQSHRGASLKVKQKGWLRRLIAGILLWFCMLLIVMVISCYIHGDFGGDIDSLHTVYFIIVYNIYRYADDWGCNLGKSWPWQLAAHKNDVFFF